MFSYISGELVHKQESIAVIENNGIGYEIMVSNNTLCELEDVGSFTKLFIYFQVKEDGIALFGFATLEEKQMFLNLITVSGVGPKMALGLLSGMRLSELGKAIICGDVGIICKVKGCGKKTAERIIIDLKDKIDAFGIAMNDSKEMFTLISNKNIDEAVEVLSSLGMNKNEAIRLARSVSEEDDSVETIVAKSLKGMGR